jgi:hypothetical protein
MDKRAQTSVYRRIVLPLPVMCMAALLLAAPDTGLGTYVIFTTDVCWSCGSDFDGI